MNKNVLRDLSYGVYIVGVNNDYLSGCVANSAMQITSSPATIAISLNHQNYTNEVIKKTKKFSLNIVDEKTNPNLISVFGFQSGKNSFKFKDVDFQMKDNLPIINECCSYLLCKVISTLETSTHTIFLAEIYDGEINFSNRPMTYAYYHQVIKGSSPKNAPTYLPENEETPKKVQGKSKKYRCLVCGVTFSINEGEEVRCPVCNATGDKVVLIDE